MTKPFTTVHDLANGLADGAYSSVELTKHFLERIAQDQNNAFVTLTKLILPMGDLTLSSC